MAGPPDPGGRGRDGRGAPAWLAVPVLSAVAGLAGALVPGVVLAALGAFRPAVAGPAMVAGAAAALWAAGPAVRAAVGRGGHGAAAVVLAGVGLATAANLAGTGQWVLSDRDPGVVASAAMVLADEGRLDLPERPGAFSVVGATGTSAAQGWSADGGRAVPQFVHGTHAVLAVARWLGGDGALLRANAVVAGLGALALFVLAAAFLPAWAAAGAGVMLAALAPQAYVARAAFSEPLAQLLVVGGAALALGAAGAGRRRGLVAAGLVLGAGLLARVDVALALAGLGPWLAAGALDAARAGRRPGRAAAWVGAGLAAAAGAAVVDGLGPARPYLALHASEVGSQLALVAAAWAASAAWFALARRRPARAPARWRGGAGQVAAGAVVAAVGALWALRPALETARERSPSLLVAALQRAEGLAVDPTRRYFEDSLRWFGWYLGLPALALATVALAAAVRAVVAGRDGGRRLLLVLGLAALPAAVFAWRVRTSPDHLWVMRRYVPVVLPLLAAAAWAGAAGLVAAVARRRPAARALAGALAVAALAIPVGVTSAPLRSMVPQAGALDAVESTCAALGPDAAVVALADETAALVLPATLAAVCRVPSVGATGPLSRAEVEELAARWARAGRRLWVASDSATVLGDLLGPAPTRSFVAANGRHPEGTLVRRPAQLDRLDWRWAVAAVAPAR